jgi:hypothetical protein
MAHVGHIRHAREAEMARRTAQVIPVCAAALSTWRVWSRTVWNPVRNLDVGLEVAYTEVNTAFGGGTVTFTAANNGLSTGSYAFEDEGVWSAALRVQRSFWP